MAGAVGGHRIDGGREVRMLRGNGSAAAGLRQNVTARDVAREASVSTATVSYVLSNRPDKSISASTRERVLQTARRLNYRQNAHAADLARGATRIVGIHLPSIGYPILL